MLIPFILYNRTLIKQGNKHYIDYTNGEKQLDSFLICLEIRTEYLYMPLILKRYKQIYRL